MKRLLRIGVAACAFVAMPTLSASAMLRATADTLITNSESSVILARSGHEHGGGHMGAAVAVTTMVGQKTAIAVGGNQ
jgi:hypothetical protein